MRARLVVLHDTKRNALHFTSTVLQGEDKWFPVVEGKNIFENVEALMVAEGVARNVTSIGELRYCGAYMEYTVNYNVSSVVDDAEFTVTYLELSHYNNGVYASKTFVLDDVTQEEHAAERQEWLDSLSIVSGRLCEEWRIGGTEGIPRQYVGEHDLDSAVFDFIQAVEHSDRDAVIAAVALQISLDKFSDAYYGEFSSVEKLAHQFVDEHAVLEDVPAVVRNYFDYEAYGRDLALESFWSHGGHYFHNHC